MNLTRRIWWIARQNSTYLLWAATEQLTTWRRSCRCNRCLVYVTHGERPVCWRLHVYYCTGDRWFNGLTDGVEPELFTSVRRKEVAAGDSQDRYDICSPLSCSSWRCIASSVTFICAKSERPVSYILPGNRDNCARRCSKCSMLSWISLGNP